MKMRRWWAGWLSVAALSLVHAQAVHIEMDQDLMQVIDDTVKDVNSNLSLQNAKAAQEDAVQLQGYFKEVETIFANHADAADGLALARKAIEAAAALGTAVASNDYEAAQTHARALGRTCKSCHDVYKST